MTTGLIGPLRVTPRGELASATDTDDLWRHHIHAALLTRARWHGDDACDTGERWMREEFGSRIHSILHHPMTEETAALAEAILVEDIHRSLPHLTLTDIQTELDEQNAALTIHLVFDTPTGNPVTTKLRMQNGALVTDDGETTWQN